MSGYFSDLLTGAKSLIDGFAVTFRALLSPAVTVQYPRQKAGVPDGYRGHPRLVFNKETGRPLCIACGLCARSCPSVCITVNGEKKQGDARKYPTVFYLNFIRCSQCGICVEVCPVTALAFSRAYGLAGFTREEFRLDLLRLTNNGS